MLPTIIVGAVKLTVNVLVKCWFETRIILPHANRSGTNIKDLTLTIGSTDFDFGDDTFNKLCSVSGNVYDHFFQTTSNPFGGTSGDVTVSINAGS